MPATYDFTGSIALITGAAGDFGRTVAVRLAGSGARLVLTDLAAAGEALEQTRQRCAALAGDDAVMACSADVTDAASVEAMFDAAGARFGAPDLVFNNAGVQGDIAPLADYSIEDFARVISINVTGIFHVLREAARRLRADGRSGAVVNSASMAGVEGAANMPAYSASKGAVMSMTRAASKDLAPLGIRVNAISPAFIGPGRMWDLQTMRQARAASQYYSSDPAQVEREMISAVPMRRVGSLDEVAATVLWLLSDESSYLTGQNLIVSGGI
jgi:NAD(P)-dependent dehydrogenase (short-subunit alcohol dehydrogenase family)